MPLGLKVREGGDKGGDRQARKPAFAVVHARPGPAVRMGSARFLRDDIEFLDLPRVVEHALAHVSHETKPSLDALVAADAEARRVAAEWKG